MAVAAILAALFWATPAAGAPSGPKAAALSLSPSSATINQCETIEVSVLVDDVADLFGADVRLTFDPAIVEVVDVDTGLPGVQVANGGFLVPPLVTARNAADNTAGTIAFAATQTYPRDPANGDGILVVISFRAKGTGTSDIEFSYTRLGTRDAEVIPATASPGTVTTVPPVPPTLSIAKLNATDARLSWTASAGSDAYRLYRDTYAYFTPADPPYQTVAGLSYDDLGALGDPDDNYFYVVRAACTNGYTGDHSNRVGEFDYALTVPTVSGTRKYNLIGVPLIVPSVTTADQLAAYVGAGVYMVMKYDAPTQNMIWRIPGIPAGTNFSVSVGGAYYLYVDPPAPTMLTFVGGVPALGAVQFALTRPSGSGSYRYNYITVPLNEIGLTTADQLAADIGGVYQILKYNAPTQSVIWRIPSIPAGTNFAVRVGYPYILSVDHTAPAVWP